MEIVENVQKKLPNVNSVLEAHAPNVQKGQLKLNSQVASLTLKRDLIVRLLQVKF